MSDSLMPQPITTDPAREYVAGGHVRTAYRARPLPWAFDDLSRELGDSIYERMLNDAQVNANLTVYKSALISQGTNLVPAISDTAADGYDLATELTAWCERQLSDMTTGLDDALWSLLDALALGCKVAEEVYRIEQSYRGRRAYALESLKVKPRRATAFVVDAYGNVAGLVGQEPNRPFAAAAHADRLLPREKFLIFTFRPKDHDPRGSTLLRAAYNAYALKMETWPEYLKYLIQFASASLIGTTAEHAPDGVDEAGNTVSAEQVLLDALLEFRNGSALALPHGSQVKELLSQGEGRAFLSAFELFDKQITTAMLTATRATMEAEFGSRADSETAAGVLETMIRQTRKALARALRRDVLMDLVRWQYGDDAVPLTPRVSFGETGEPDVAGLMAAIAALQRVNYLDPSQLPGIDAMLQLPARSPDELARRQPADRAADAPEPAPMDDADDDDTDEEEER